ncbi:MAG TPA: hypothetical protein VMF13_09885 [Luteitalea sp.]|nr:hypothetical protein [Luteitalea sp.]
MPHPVTVARSVVVFAVLAAAGTSHPLQAQAPTPPPGRQPVTRPAPPAATRTQPVAPSESAGTSLPVRRVVLYKSGVGYFEHVGRIRDAQTVSIDLTSSQLDDVLKSLTTVDLGEGRVTGITFNSIAPLEQRLKGIGLPLGPSASRAELLSAVRGSRVEVQAGASRTVGRVLGLESRPRTSGDNTEQVEHLAVVADGGAVHFIELKPGVVVRLLDGDIRGDLGQYLDALQSARTQEVRRMSVHTAGAGVRDLFVSYVSEVPVWKTTYRLVVPQEANRKPFLQGWAVVDNTLGEDWDRVQLSLVAGAPQSFVQPLSQPIYTRRPVVPLATTTLTTPQTHGATMATGAGPIAETEAVVAAEEALAMQDAAKMRANAGAPARFSPAPPPPPAAPAPGAVMARLSQSQAAATGADLGDLFEYSLKEPITIRRNESALVPILQATVGVERVSLWSAASGSARPLRAVWITNDTGATLDGGSMALMEGNAFAGEGLVEPVKPGERRFISFAADLAGRVTMSNEGGPRRLSRVRIARGMMTQSYEERSTAVYTIRNEDAAPRTFIIEHPIREGWGLARNGPPPVESTATVHRFRVVARPSSTETLKIEEVHPIETRVALSTVTDEQIALVLRGRNVDVAAEPQLRAIVTQSQEVARQQAAVRERQAEVQRITQDQARVRENLGALKGSAEERALAARYTKQLTTQEDRLDVLRTEIEQLEAARTKAQQELARLVNAVSIDAEIP